MTPKLQLKFDANQEHQLQAVGSVVRLFGEIPRYGKADFFLICDDRLLRSARRLALTPKILDPVDYVRKARDKWS